MEVTLLLPADAASHYKAIRTVLFARTTPWEEEEGGGGDDGAAEITIKGLCGGPTAAPSGSFGVVPRGLDPPAPVRAETMPEQEVSLLFRGLILARG